MFGQNLCKKGISGKKTEHYHWILNIRISLATKFQLKLMILIFLTKSTQKGTEFQFKLTIWIFWTKVCQKRIFPVKSRKIGHHHWILYIGISLGTKFHFNSNKQFLIMWPNLPKKVILGRKWKNVNITIEFCLFNLAEVPNFKLNWQVWFFGINVPKKGVSGLKQKNCTFACVHGANRRNDTLMSKHLLELY